MAKESIVVQEPIQEVVDDWRVGKTESSIRFVLEAEVFIKKRPETERARILLQIIDRIKTGQLVMNNSYNRFVQGGLRLNQLRYLLVAEKTSNF